MINQENVHIQELVDQLRSLTSNLEDSVLTEEADAELWVTLLDEREAVIEQISQLLQNGAHFTDRQKEELEKIHVTTQKLLTVMTTKKDSVQKQIANLNKAKTANQQYNGGYGYTPYGAFFDKKK